MNRTLMLSDDLYRRLEVLAQQQGLERIEALLERWEQSEAERCRREEVVRAARRLQERFSERYGEMEDSTLLLRADRER